jgi:uncharacterized protein YdhG (YjbR/CyaY superfamily)
MSTIDDYLKNISPAQRTELERIRAIAREMLPGAQEIISYRMPTIRYEGKSIIGFDAHKNHIGIYPYSGHIIEKIKELDSYDKTPGAIREKLDNLLPKELLQKIINARLEQALGIRVG